jgi:hypothetical protein
MTKPLEQAIPLGLGRGVKEEYFFDFGDQLHFAKDGSRINPFVKDEKGEETYIDPKTLPNYDHSNPVILQAGKPQDMPYLDEELMQALVDRGEFAHPKMQEQIEGWIKEGLESHDLIAKVREAGGLVTMKDFGFTPAEKVTNKSEAGNTSTGG